MLTITNFELTTTAYNQDGVKRWWVFKHKYNPTKVKVVFQDYKGRISGDEYLVEQLKNLGLLDKYVPSKNFIKKHNDMINRIQTMQKMGYKGINNLNFNY